MIRSVFILFLFLLLLGRPVALAQGSEEPERLVLKNEYSIGRVMEITAEESAQGPDGKGLNQTAKVLLKSGSEKGQTIEVPNYFSSSDLTRLKKGESVIINKTHGLTGDSYYIADKYRLWPAAIATLIFFVAVVIFTRRRGIMAVLGLVVSFLILLKIVLPAILAGWSPLWMSLLGALLIAVISLYLAHGWRPQTTVALVSTLLTLGIAVLAALLFVTISKLTGAGTEESFYLQLAPNIDLNLRGLLLGGIIIGALGVLDDITTAQVAAVTEIYRANQKLEFWDLYRRGLAVGQEHIVSLVNTLVLAYVGASFPLFLLFALNTQTQPLWVTLNSELIMEEIIRTLVGSLALVFAVPISTVLATYALQRTELFSRVLTEEVHHAGHHH